LFSADQKNRWRILFCFATSLSGGIIHMLLNDDFYWNEYYISRSIARNLGGIFGYALSIGLPCWILIIIAIIAGIVKITKNKNLVRNEKDKFYAIAFDELQNNQFDKVTLAKVMAANQNTSEQIKSAYIKIRVAQLEKEFINKQKNTPSI
jgi:uncharacterized membrane protein (DUF106 family)